VRGERSRRNDGYRNLELRLAVSVGLLGLYLTRRWAQRLHIVDHSHNDIVGFYLAAVTVLYGITLGLLAIGAWRTYSDVQSKVDHEATTLGSLFRDVSAYPDPTRSVLQEDGRNYTRLVIDVGWPMQRRGIVPNGAATILDRFQAHFMSCEPGTEQQKILALETYRSFNELVEDRRARLNTVSQGMPGPLWALVVVGAMVCIAVTWCFHTPSFSMHLWMTVLFAALLRMMIYLIGVLDNPYRGKLSVGPEALERVYQQTMLRGK
jgi:hypothetical protein